MNEKGVSLYTNGEKKFKVFIGSSCHELGRRICAELGIKTGEINCGFFSNGETRVEILETVRGLDVFLVQTGADCVNDHLMELLIMIHCCRFASASKITAVIPCYPYARQDKKDISRAPITAKLVADMLTRAGANHIITMDLHAWQIQGFFDVPLDNLLAEPLLVDWIRTNLPHDAILISPDAGGVKRVASIADCLGMDFALIHKERRVANLVSNMTIVGSVSGRDIVLIDDMADTCGTVMKATEKLREAGALRIFVMCVHGIFSGDSLNRIRKSSIERFFITNTIDNSNRIKDIPKISVIDVGPTIAEAIRRTANNESISFLFKHPCKPRSPM